MKHALATLAGVTLAWFGSAMLFAATPLDKPALHESTKIAPAYFGPNAFPIPDMLDGTTLDKLHIELAGTHYFGFRSDHTSDLFAKIAIPLWTERVNLTVWMPIVEYWRNTPESAAAQRQPAAAPLRGHEFGDVYISTDIHVLRQTKYRPDISARAAMKTASGGSYHLARYYDSPGYFFDATIAKSILFAENRFVEELRFAASSGFLCWQTNNGRQNDAVMYGAMAKLRTKYFTTTAVFNGYAGWEKNGDRPMSIKAQISGHIKNFEPYAAYQYGIKDYPFHQLRIGLAYNINILKKQQQSLVISEK